MNIRQVLFHLAIRNEERREEVIQWLRLHTPKTFARQARLGKVAPAVIETLEMWHIDMPTLAPLKQFVLESANQRQFYDQEIQDLQECGEILPQSILILKGRALQRWYPGNLPPRQSIDLDFVIEDEEQFWQVGKWLLNRQYTIPMMGIAYPDRIRQKDWHIILTYEKRIPDAESEVNTSFASIEILQGVTSLSLRHFCDLRPLITRARNAVKQSVSSEKNVNPFFLYPTREDCLLTILVEISERKLEIRDAVDFYMLIGINKENSVLMLNWSSLSRIIEEESLTIQFLRLASHYTSVSGNALPLAIEQTYRQWQRKYIYWKWIARSPTLNLIAFSYARRFQWTHVLKEVLLNLWETALDSSLLERLPLYRQSKALSYHSLDRRETLARLLYLAPNQVDVCHWERGKEGELLLYAPVGIFLATRSITFTSAFLEKVCSQFPKD